jgi:hypothetical protein
MLKLGSNILGVVRDEQGRDVAFSIPAESIIELAGEEKVDGTVDVLCGEQIVNVFTADLKARAAQTDSGMLAVSTDGNAA